MEKNRQINENAITTSTNEGNANSINELWKQLRTKTNTKWDITWQIKCSCLVFPVWAPLPRKLLVQAEDFGKLSAPVFRIFLDWFRAPGTKIRPISSYFSFFSAFWPQKVWTSNFSLIFLKEQALKPCSDCRSRDLLHGKTITALYDQIWPTWWQNNVATFCGCYRDDDNQGSG